MPGTRQSRNIAGRMFGDRQLALTCQKGASARPLERLAARLLRQPDDDIAVALARPAHRCELLTQIPSAVLAGEMTQMFLPYPAGGVVEILKNR